jgi:UDP-N-acetyl-D-mannosaminuronic acid dehydrogenase
MGLAFKPNIDDLRESPAKYIVSRVISETRADVLVVEPNIDSHISFNLSPADSAYDNADIVIWLVKHNAFLDIKVNFSKIELDFCGIRS